LNVRLPLPHRQFPSRDSYRYACQLRVHSTVFLRSTATSKLSQQVARPTRVPRGHRARTASFSKRATKRTYCTLSYFAFDSVACQGADTVPFVSHIVLYQTLHWSTQTADVHISFIVTHSDCCLLLNLPFIILSFDFWRQGLPFVTGLCNQISRWYSFERSILIITL
jgi:hypothetical protein